MLPLIVLFVLPLLSSLLSSSSSESAGPSFKFDTPAPPYTLHRKTPRLKLDYYLNPREVEDYPYKKLNQLDRQAENSFIQKLQYECEVEVQGRQRMMQEAQGWFFQDVDRMREAREMELRSCQRLEDLRVPRSY